MASYTANVNTDFAEWATLQSGCDGGNLNGTFWLCGIEWGGEEAPQDVDFAKLSQRLQKQPERSKCSHKKVMKNQKNHYIFDLRSYQLFGTICANSRLDRFRYDKFAERVITYRLDSQFYKMNLFPISLKTPAINNGIMAGPKRRACPPRDCTGFGACHKGLPRLERGLKKGNPRLLSLWVKRCGRISSWHFPA